MKLVDVVAGGAHPSERGPIFSRETDGSALLVATFTSLTTLSASIARP